VVLIGGEMPKALKTIFGFRRWMNFVEIVLYLILFVVLLMTAYGHIFGGE